MKQEQALPEIPKGINVPMIEMIHSGKDSFIPFMRKNPDTGEMENLFSLPREGLRTYFPDMFKWLAEDAYMGINSTYSPAPWLNRTTGLPDAARGEGLLPGKKCWLRYLNAVYADLDVGRPDDSQAFKRTPWAKALAVAEVMMNEGKLPQASLYANSGRGLYLLWLLRDPEDPNKPQRAWREKILLYKEIEKALGRKLKRLAFDQNAVDSSRVLKVPGTTDTRTGRRVGYWFRIDDNGMPWHYTLEGLAEALQVGSHEKELPPGGFTTPFFEIRPGADVRTVSEKGKGSCPNRLAGSLARNMARVRDLLKIEKLYNGFPQGKRRRSLILLGECLKLSGANEADIRSMLESAAKRCVPPYPSDKADTPVDAIFKNVKRGPSTLARSGNAALCRYYDIDREAAIDGELESIMPADLKAELRAAEKAQAAQERATAKAEELTAVKRLWERSGHGFGYRQLAEALTASGFPMSKDKVMRLLNKVRADKIKGKK
jgi:hypothetical protein